MDIESSVSVNDQYLIVSNKEREYIKIPVDINMLIRLSKEIAVALYQRNGSSRWQVQYQDELITYRLDERFSSKEETEQFIKQLIDKQDYYKPVEEKNG